MRLNGIIGVYYREMSILRSRLLRGVLSSLVSPALFFMAFGYGFGRQRMFYGMEYLDFLFAGLLAMSTLNACYGLASEVNIARFYFRTFDEYLLAPAPRWQIVAGEMLYGISKGGITACAFILLAWVAGVNLRLSPSFFAALLLHMAIFSLLGLGIALAVKNHGDQGAISSFVITPMTFLSGVFFPVEQMPLALRWLVQAFPVTHSVNLLRAAQGGAQLSGADWAILLGFLILAFSAALLAAKRAGTT